MVHMCTKGPQRVKCAEIVEVHKIIKCLSPFTQELDGEAGAAS